MKVKIGDIVLLNTHLTQDDQLIEAKIYKYQSGSILVSSTLEPRDNEVSRDWENVFVISRVRYIGASLYRGFDISVFVITGVHCIGIRNIGFRYIGVIYIGVRYIGFSLYLISSILAIFYNCTAIRLNLPIRAEVKIANFMRK